MMESEQVKRAALELLGKALPNMKWETAIEVMRAMSVLEGDDGTTVLEYNATVPEEMLGREQRSGSRQKLPDRSDLRPGRVLAIGIDIADANEVLDRGISTSFVAPGDPCTGQPYDAIAYGPKFKAILDWYESVALPRLKPDAEGRR
jgi:hypothetical protein